MLSKLGGAPLAGSPGSPTEVALILDRTGGKVNVRRALDNWKAANLSARGELAVCTKHMRSASLNSLYIRNAAGRHQRWQLTARFAEKTMYGADRFAPACLMTSARRGCAMFLSKTAFTMASMRLVG